MATARSARSLRLIGHMLCPLYCCLGGGRRAGLARANIFRPSIGHRILSVERLRHGGAALDRARLHPARSRHIVSWRQHLRYRTWFDLCGISSFSPGRRALPYVAERNAADCARSLILVVVRPRHWLKGRGRLQPYLLYRALGNNCWNSWHRSGLPRAIAVPGCHTKPDILQRDVAIRGAGELYLPEICEAVGAQRNGRSALPAKSTLEWGQSAISHCGECISSAARCCKPTIP